MRYFVMKGTMLLFSMARKNLLYPLAGYKRNGGMMNKQQVLSLLEKHKPELARRFGVRDLALFGSTARDEAGEESDVDILVSFNGPATSARYFGLQFYLEDHLGRPVDLVTDKALRPELRPYVDREAIHVG